jgi:hypothetical protein
MSSVRSTIRSSFYFNAYYAIARLHWMSFICLQTRFYLSNQNPKKHFFTKNSIFSIICNQFKIKSSIWYKLLNRYRTDVNAANLLQVFFKKNCLRWSIDNSDLVQLKRSNFAPLFSELNQKLEREQEKYQTIVSRT